MRVRLRRSLDCGHDLFCQRAAVEAVRALFCEELVRRGEVGVLEDTSDGGCVAAREEQAAGRRKRLKADLVVEGLLTERFVDQEAAARNVDGRFQGIVEVQGPPALEGTLPGGRCAGNANRHAARDELGREVVGLAGRGVDESVVRHGLRRGFAAVDGADPAVPCVVEDEVAAAADPGAVRLGHAQGRGCGDGGVRRVAAVAEDLDCRGGCLRVHGAHRAAVPGGGCGLVNLVRNASPGSANAGAATAPPVTLMARAAVRAAIRLLTLGMVAPESG